MILVSPIRCINLTPTNARMFVMQVLEKELIINVRNVLLVTVQLVLMTRPNVHLVNLLKNCKQKLFVKQNVMKNSEMTMEYVKPVQFKTVKLAL